ncbi:TniQ family protein [Alcaligenes nematophilus]
MLIKLAPYRTEGPNGYLLRLAEANRLEYSDLPDLGVTYDADALLRSHLLPERGLDPALLAWVQNIATLRQKTSRVWNMRYSRFCPLCLNEEPSWRAEWELCFYDACAQHGVWMVDRCSSCHEPVSWRRSQVVRCGCGADLRAEPSHLAPAEVTQLSQVLSRKLTGRGAADMPEPLRDLNVDQTQRLIRYLGMHLDPAGVSKSLKLSNVGRMEVSWPVTSVAAAILSGWPTAFHVRFSEIQERSGGKKVGLPKLFQRAYSYLYKGLKEPAFDAVRYSFEQWLVENWRGGLALRNRRLAGQLLHRVHWIPANVAAERLGVRVARIRRLVSEGVIDGHESYSSTGRRFLLIRKEQVDELTHADLSEVDLTTAMEYLGLGKVRMRELLRLLFPSAYRPLSEYGFPPWRISRQDVERYLAIGEGLPILSIPEESQVPLFHVLKYWAWNENEIIDLIEAVRDGEIVLEGLLDGAIGLARWIFDSQSLKIWRQSRNPELSNWLSVPQVAKLLGLKQEVAYWLVRNEFIPAEKLRTLRGCGARVSRVEFERFKESYVFATEIAEALKTTSRKVSALLSEQGIVPASGQGLEKCGKIFYVRSKELMNFLATLNVTLPSADFAVIDSRPGNC